MAQHRDRRGGQYAVGDQLGALGEEDGRVHGQQADEVLAVGADGVGAGVGALADEVGLLLRHRPAHAQVLRGDRAVGVLTDDRVALLGAQDVHGLGPVRGDAVRGTGLVQRLPQREGVPRRHVDLVGEFTGEADPAHARLDARHGRLPPRHEREVVVGHGKLGRERAEEPAGAWADQGDGRPLLGDGGAVDAQFGPLGLQPLLHPVQNGRRVAGGGGDQEALLGEPDDGAVVEDHAVRAAHHAVADRAGLQGAHHVGVEQIEEGCGVRPLHVDLAEGGGVHERDALAGGTALAQHGGLHVLAVLRVVPGPLPLTDVLEEGAVLGMPAVQGGRAYRVVQRATVAAREGGEGDGRVGRAERRQAERGDVHAEEFRDDAAGENAGCPALVVGRACRGVALGVLDRAQARSGRAGQVVDGDVALEVDEAGCVGRCRDREDVHGRRLWPGGDRGQRGSLSGVALGFDGTDSRRRALGEHCGEVEGAGRAARDLQRLTAGVRDERAERLVGLNRCATGFQPPETSRRSTANSRRPANSPYGATVTAVRRASPSVPVTAWPVSTSIPADRARSAHSPGVGRVSTTAAISTPAAARSRAAG